MMKACTSKTKQIINSSFNPKNISKVQNYPQIAKVKKKNMLPMLNNCGLPLCLSGISHSLAFHKEKADHDRRREAMKKMRPEETMHGDEEVLMEAKGFSCYSLACTAKAA